MSKSNVQSKILNISFQIQNTKHKFLIINLIISELAISCVGVPLDFYHIVAASEDENRLLCSSTGFIHTLFGNCQQIEYIFEILCEA